MGRIVIVAMRPKAGKAETLKTLVEKHVQVLRGEGLATDRAPVVMTASNGDMVEVFEWASQDAISSAHENPRVQKLWAEYAEVCEFIPVSQVPEAENLFSEFAPLD